jgi:hypothetical protein
MDAKTCADEAKTISAATLATVILFIVRPRDETMCRHSNADSPCDVMAITKLQALIGFARVTVAARGYRRRAKGVGGCDRPSCDGRHIGHSGNRLPCGKEAILRS